MGKHYGLAAVLSAMLTLSGVGACSALASETEPELLVNKGKVTAVTEVNSTGELELTDLKAVLGVAASVKCSGVIMGTVAVGGKTGEVTSVLSLEGTQVTEANPLVCTNVKNCAEPLLWPVDLPWPQKFEFMSASPWKTLLVLGSSTKLPGWTVNCMSLKLTDTCSAEAASLPGLLVENMTGGVLLGVFLQAELEEEGLEGSCSLSKEKTADVNNVEESGTLTSGTSELEVS